MYSREDITKALLNLEVSKGDCVFVHSNLGFFGRAEGISSLDALCRLWYESIIEVIGEEGTLIVPTFTYSYCRKEVFEHDKSDSDCGAFSNWVCDLEEAERSRDPNYSVAAVGKLKEYFSDSCTTNSFNDESAFARLLKQKGKILNLNFDAGSTFLHYVERELGVPYRFDKTFQGTTRAGGTTVETENTIFVRYLSDTTYPVFEPFHELAVRKNLFNQINIGKGIIGVISAQSTFDLVKESLSTRPNMLIKAEQLGCEPVLEVK